MDTQNMCAKFPGLSLKNSVDFSTFVRKTGVFLCSYLQFLGFSVGSNFCDMCYLILNVGRSDLRMFA